jgi:hypothetical protein
MPRAYLPKLAARPKVVPFKLTESNKQTIARTIPGAQDLSPKVAEMIESAVACYRATKAGLGSCTIANMRFALRQLEKKGRGRQEALRLLADDRAAVDYTILDAIQNPAKAVLAKEPGAEENLLAIARNQAAKFQQHPRVVPANEPLRFFCGVLREIFKVATAHLNQPITWRLCRRFAWAVFEAADIERDHFRAHPGRLTEYLQTDVTTD